MVNWDDYFMSMVYLVASKSKDQRTYIGAVVVGSNKEIVSGGYNGFPRGVNDDVFERQQKPLKNKWFEHAERNAVYNATLIGSSLKGCKMYTNGFPCSDCARAIIQSGIKEIIVDKLWNEENSYEDKTDGDISSEMFREAGVSVRYWEGNLLNIEKFRRGSVLNKTENKMKLKVKKLYPYAIIPQRAHEGDAGLDIYSAERFVLGPNMRHTFSTGISMEIPKGYVALVWDKSGLASKKGITVLGGVIDSGYRGEYKIVLYNTTEDEFDVNIGDKIAQVLIQPVESAEIEEVDELSDSSRGEGGFGSTGR